MGLRVWGCFGFVGFLFLGGGGEGEVGEVQDPGMLRAQDSGYFPDPWPIA